MWKTRRLPKKDRKPVKHFLIALSGSTLVLLAVISYLGVGFANRFALVSPVPETFSKLLILSSSRDRKDAAELARKLSLRSISYSSILSASQSGLLVKMKDSSVFFSTRKSFDEQLSSLQLILSRLTIEGKHFVMLDFRFAKPVVVLAN